MHLAVTLKGMRDCEIAERPSRQNLWLVPLSTSHLGEASRQGFILGFGSTCGRGDSQCRPQTANDPHLPINMPDSGRSFCPIGTGGTFTDRISAGSCPVR